MFKDKFPVVVLVLGILACLAFWAIPAITMQRQVPANKADVYSTDSVEQALKLALRNELLKSARLAADADTQLVLYNRKLIDQARECNEKSAELLRMVELLSRKLEAEENIIRRIHNDLNTLAMRGREVERQTEGGAGIAWVCEALGDIRDMVVREGRALDTITVLPGRPK